MITIFHAPLTRSVRVLWACEELGLPYTVVPIVFEAARPPEFVEINPSGTLPAFRDGEVMMTESVAILQYLADRYGPTPLAVAPGQPGYPDYLQFMFLGEAGLAAPLNAPIMTRFFAPEDQRGGNWTVEAVLAGFHRRLKLVDRRLKESPYMAGPDFTLADISVGYALGLGHMLGETEKMSDAVKDYYARVTARPAYLRATAGA